MVPNVGVTVFVVMVTVLVGVMVTVLVGVMVTVLGGVMVTVLVGVIVTELFVVMVAVLVGVMVTVLFVVMVPELFVVMVTVLVGVMVTVLVGVMVTVWVGLIITLLLVTMVELVNGLQPPVARYLPVNCAQAPGRSMIGPSTWGLPGWLLNTKMFVKVVLPELQTNPPKSTELPLVTGLGGQLSVMVMTGMVRIGQVALAVLVTKTSQILKPLAVKVSATEQLVGAT